ncbi:DNA repair exonuclease [Hesseltinella vesiculosa]|uniref:Double-strand break repair protein n=1 Tax=Hesseltinella vesiculosa TaxID=101127 RepID=A0A1X2GPL4_9FUNG|nr:DNA repair exonuclease [Hesseltinella vesiculosa]
MDDQDTENTFKILLATDNHLGYLEDDPIRGQDSFNTFEEILKLAKQHNVDFILLGGDLFHHNRPSRPCLYQTMRLLRRYCMGDRPSQVWIASDQSEHFQDEFATANYLDPNINVSFPVFSIHGNHDDPNGPGNLCSLHLLSMAGLVNYFGKHSNVQNLAVQPILMQKGDSKLCLYGLGNVRDERLHRAWRDGHVKFLRPRNEEWRDNHCFNMLVLHQNRVRHGPTNYIPEQFLEPFLDLVFWGHEHDCRIEPEATVAVSLDDEGPFVTQPGSSVATSLTEGESQPKHVGLLKIKGDRYNLEKLPLRTVRPFVFSSVSLSQTDVPVGDSKACQRYLTTVIENLIDQAKEEWQEQQDQASQGDIVATQLAHATMPLPLIRVRVDYTGGYEIFNPQQFGQPFAKRVANAKDILKFQRTRSSTRTASTAPRSAIDILDDSTTSVPERLDQIKVEDLVHEFLENNLAMLAENELEDAVKNFVDKDDKDAIRRFIRSTLTHTQAAIQVTEDIDALTDEFVKRKAAASKMTRLEDFARRHAGVFTRREPSAPAEEDDDMAMQSPSPAPPTRRRRRPAEAAASSTTPSRNRSTTSTATNARHQAQTTPLGEDQEDGEEVLTTTTKRRRVLPTNTRPSRRNVPSDQATLHQTIARSTPRNRSEVTSDRQQVSRHDQQGTVDDNDEDEDDDPLFEDDAFVTHTQPRRTMPSSLSQR